MRRHVVLLSFFVLLSLQAYSSYSYGQQWSGIIDKSRAINWTNVNPGVVGGIPNRSTICTTLNSGATAAQINSAISSCPTGQVVKLNAGTYNLSTGIIFNGKSNVTLRGDGPDKTFITGSGTNSCDGHGAMICVFGYSGCEDCTTTTRSWTSGYAQGSTIITLNSTASMSVGMILALSQANDSSDPGGIWVNDTVGVGSIEGGCGPSVGAHKGYCQTQLVQVTAINGNNVTISPGVYETNIRAGQTPRVWFTGTSASTPSTGVGIEDLSLDNISAGAYSIISFHNTTNSWAKNVRTLNGTRNHFGFWLATHIEVRDCYSYGTQNAASQSYGTEPEFASDLLIINNIYQHITSPAMMGNNAGSVYAYNYAIDMYYTSPPTFMQTSFFGSHDAGVHMLLYEGNDGAQALWDTYHGAGGNQVTYFRTYLNGWETGKTGGTIPVAIWANNRANNLVGNVLGQSGYHNSYEGSGNNIYMLGDAAWAGSSYNGVAFDPIVKSSLLRWGNYDVVTGTRFNSAEVPTTGIAFINGNSVPASQTLPPSFFLPAQPTSWWTTPWGTPAWPPIGPDVSCSGSNCITGVANHVSKIPARLCYENSPKAGGILTFNADNCYGGGTSASNPPPAPPTNLRVF